MGIVLRQSAANTLVTYVGFAFGAVNTLFLYTTFLGKLDYGIVQFVVSGATILMPFLALGLQNTLIRFFARYPEGRPREEFLTFVLAVPLVMIAAAGLCFWLGYDWISDVFLKKNPAVRPYLAHLLLIGVFMAYFEIFYAWVKVHMRSVLGNLINELLVRVVVMAALFGVHYDLIAKGEFLYYLTIAYGLQCLFMLVYALKIHPPQLHLRWPKDTRELLYYSIFTIVSGGIAVMLVEFDKLIIGWFGLNERNAEYAVGIFIATVIAVPSRAMLQIVQPITARLMAEEKYGELDLIYKRSAITLQYFGGLILLLIFLNIHQMYAIIPGGYAAGTMTVFFIGLSKFFDVMLGNNNAIILNTKYYRVVLLFGLLLVIMMIVLNLALIPLYGITGSALATLISVGIYNTVKLWFVVRKTGMFPFTAKTWKSLSIIAILFVAFYFWDFPFHPLVNIVLKSGLIVAAYVPLNHYFAISPDVNDLIGKSMQKIRRRKA